MRKKDAPLTEYTVGIAPRVSTIQQAEKFSPGQQVDACKKEIAATTPSRAGDLPIRILEPFFDAVSGDGRHRDGLERAKDKIRARQMQELWVYNPDRLGRDMRSIMEFSYFCRDHGCLLFFVDAPIGYDLDGDMDPTSKLAITVKAWAAEQEKKKIKERTANGRMGLVLKGIQPQRARAPYGYKIWQKWEAITGACTAEDVGRYAFSDDPLPRQIAVEIFERVARRETMRSVAAGLQRRGIPSPSGGVIWQPTVIREIIKREVYRGVAYYGKRKCMTDKGREEQGMSASYHVAVPRSEWKSFEAPRLVSDELWQAANDALADNRQFKSGNVEHRFLLTGFLRCPKCEGPMGGRKNGKPVAWYYICFHDHVRMGKHYTENSCSMRCVRSSAVELRVAEALEVACLQPAIVQMAVQDYTKAATANVRGEASEKARAALLERKEAVARKMRSIRRSMEQVCAINEFANVDGFAEDYARESATLDSISAEILSLPEPNKVADYLPDPLEAAQRVTAMLQRLPEALASPLMTVHEKRVLLDAVLLRVTPIEGPTSGKRVNWSVDVVLKPEIWHRAAFPESLGVYGTSRCETLDASL